MTNQQPGSSGWLNWGGLEQWFKQYSPLQNLPFVGQSANGSWLQAYMKHLNEQMMGFSVSNWQDHRPEENTIPVSPQPQQHTDSPNRNFHYELVDLSNKMKARLYLPEETNLRRIKLFAGDHQLRLEGLPMNQTEIIHLPCKVAGRMGKAVCQDDILVVTLFKNNGVHLREMDIDFRP